MNSIECAGIWSFEQSNMPARHHFEKAFCEYHHQRAKVGATIILYIYLIYMDDLILVGQF
jgi:hypothetical protein